MSAGKGPSALETAVADAMAAAMLRWEESQVQLAQSLGGTLLRGARAFPLAGAGGGGMRVSFADGSLIGFALRETTGAGTATVELRAHDASGDLLVPINLTAGGTAREWFAGGGVSYADGLYIAITGAVDGSVFLRGRDE